MYGLLGRKLGHSLSPQIHSLYGSYPYRLFCREENELDSFFADKTVNAFNVTIPYKTEAFRRCDELSETAKKTGNVNTVIRKADGTLYGDNTDYFGFMMTAKRYGADFRNKKVLVLGSGGASLTVQTVAKDSGAREIVVVSRSGENNYNNIAKHFDSEIIVNATPVGMFPNNGEKLIDLKNFSKAECVLDLVYNPLKTQLLLDAEELSLNCGNGLYMLAAQALRSAELFLNKKLDVSLIEKAYDEIMKQSRNIIFVGMPSCGKSTVGKILAEKLGRKIVDIDVEIEKNLNKKIPEIFSENGEDFFRKKESEIIKEATKNLGCVVATGGGAVIKKENRNAIKQNGIVVYLKRDLCELSTVGRPLSENEGAVRLLYEERREIYESIADITVEVGGNAQKTAERVKECLYL